ncbi:hypothetical protein GCM10011309_17420 [Litorimonas cladophorae]|uniref:PH domain-containing protein n=2 Tax=Litorimonas cladophorae TaxID=1220491 RepID=A0A918KMN4_9PROT|nr:hypothetical protein GCM10011309_17420 [Litorimonas cladophorae]
MKRPPIQKLKHASYFWPGFMLISLTYAAFMAVPTREGNDVGAGNPEIFVVAGLLGAVFCFAMMLFSPSLKLSPSGFAFRYPLKSYSHAWLDVSEFRVSKFTKGRPSVSFDLLSDTHEKTKTFDATFGYAAADLAKLFNTYRAYALFEESEKNYAIFADQDVTS